MVLPKVRKRTRGRAGQLKKRILLCPGDNANNRRPAAIMQNAPLSKYAKQPRKACGAGMNARARRGSLFQKKKHAGGPKRRKPAPDTLKPPTRRPNAECCRIRRNSVRQGNMTPQRRIRA
ncbi:hypothetical protein JCM16814_04590 [Desulfobaculum senezii]